jgi:hypothetical protein
MFQKYAHSSSVPLLRIETSESVVALTEQSELQTRSTISVLSMLSVPVLSGNSVQVVAASSRLYSVRGEEFSRLHRRLRILHGELLSHGMVRSWKYRRRN